MLAERSCLVLNGDYRVLSTWPLSIVPVRDAFEIVYKGKATVVEDWGTVFRTAKAVYPVPKVIALNEYINVHAEPKFCRRSIYLRDRFRCQYCGERFPTQELTFDHVVPKSKGGTTIWENILTCCIKCNIRKGNQQANYSGRRGVDILRPLKEPRRPTAFELLKAGIEFLDPAIQEDFSSWLYWNAELKA